MERSSERANARKSRQNVNTLMKTRTYGHKNAKQNGSDKNHPPQFRRRVLPDLPNTERAVFVTGEINDEMVAKLTPQIITLKRTSTDPINVLIDSDGGSVRGARVILGLLKTPDARGACCSINTIVTGNACSAAADLLAAGDYIAAYQHAYIHFHGTGMSDVLLTAASAHELSQDLLSEDKCSSAQLAGAVFPRQLDNYSKLLKEVRQWRETSIEELKSFDVLVGEGSVDVPAFAVALADKLQTPYQPVVVHCLEETVRRASILKQFREVTDLGRQLPPMLRSAIKQKHPDADAAARVSRELVLLTALVADRIANEPDWDLSSKNFNRLEQTFLQLREVMDGTFEDGLLQQVSEWGTLFMSPRDLRFFKRYKLSDLDNPKIAAEFDGIVGRTSTKLESLWSFTLTLCGLLNIGENPVTPNDAYWLGLIDEVLGTPLARRKIPRSVRASLLTQMPLPDSQRFY
jgi:hypothetical protein